MGQFFDSLLVNDVLAAVQNVENSAIRNVVENNIKYDVEMRKEKVRMVSIPLYLDKNTVRIINNCLILNVSTVKRCNFKFMALNFAGKDEQTLFSTDIDVCCDKELKLDINNIRRFSLVFSFLSDCDIQELIYDFDVNDDNTLESEKKKVKIDGKIVNISTIFQRGIEESNNGSSILNTTCIICCTDVVSMISCPCMHCCMCESCSKSYTKISTYCPICRQQIEEIINLDI